MAGSTSPYSFAGSLAQGNAEALFPVLVAQVLEPGFPVIYGFDPTPTDMHSGEVRYYPPDKMLFLIASGQIGRYYGLPYRGIFVGSMVERFDPQMGIENVLFALACLATKQNLVSSLGSCFNANGVSPEKIIVDDALAELVERLCQGFEMDDLHLGIDTIHKVGPGGHFLGEEMTRDLLRSGEFFDHITDC